MAEWFPTVFYTFKFVVLGIGMFYAVKWHYDQGKKKDGVKERRAVLRAAGKATAVFVVSLLVLGLVTFFLATKLGLDLRL